MVNYIANTISDKYSVINVFLLDYYTRLREWHKLKETLVDQDLSTICIEVDRFWQRAPINTHYLHPDEIENWPNPWELISDNHYCYYGRALGIIYTLMLLGVKELDFVDALDDNRDNVVLVLVDNAKYVLNYWPESVLNMNLSGFTIVKHINISSLKKKIGKE
jgi:hypothetical protein